MVISASRPCLDHTGSGVCAADDHISWQISLYPHAGADIPETVLQVLITLFSDCYVTSIGYAQTDFRGEVP